VNLSDVPARCAGCGWNGCVGEAAKSLTELSCPRCRSPRVQVGELRVEQHQLPPKQSWRLNLETGRHEHRVGDGEWRET
jgi:hypothetical protein